MKNIFKLIETNKLIVLILKNNNPVPQGKIPFVALVTNKAGFQIKPFWLWQKRPSKRPLKISAANFHIMPLERVNEETLLKKGVDPRHLYWIGSFSGQNKKLIMNFWNGGKIAEIESKIQRSCNTKSYYPEYMPLGDYFLKILNEKCSLVVCKQNQMLEVLSNKEVNLLQQILLENNKL